MRLTLAGVCALAQIGILFLTGPLTTSVAGMRNTAAEEAPLAISRFDKAIEHALDYELRSDFLTPVPIQPSNLHKNFLQGFPESWLRAKIKRSWFRKKIIDEPFKQQNRQIFQSLKTQQGHEAIANYRRIAEESFRRLERLRKWNPSKPDRPTMSAKAKTKSDVQKALELYVNAATRAMAFTLASGGTTWNEDVAFLDHDLQMGQRFLAQYQEHWGEGQGPPREGELLARFREEFNQFVVHLLHQFDILNARKNIWQRILTDEVSLDGYNQGRANRIADEYDIGITQLLLNYNYFRHQAISFFQQHPEVTPPGEQSYIYARFPTRDELLASLQSQGSGQGPSGHSATARGGASSSSAT